MFSEFASNLQKTNPHTYIIIKYREKNRWIFGTFEFSSYLSRRNKLRIIWYKQKITKTKRRSLPISERHLHERENGLKRLRRNCWICLQGGNLRSYNQLKGIWTMNTLNLIRLPRFGHNPHDIWGNNQILYRQALITYQLPKSWRFSWLWLAISFPRDDG